MIDIAKTLATESPTARGAVEGWYVELRDDQNKQRCITCGVATYGRNACGEPQDFTCYFDALVAA